MPCWALRDTYDFALPTCTCATGQGTLASGLSASLLVSGEGSRGAGLYAAGPPPHPQLLAAG